MKAITVHQPWATAIARGSKMIETRSWRTRYRGPIAIHAAARALSVDELIDYTTWYNWCAALGWNTRTSLESARDSLPLGAIVAVGELIDCRVTGHFQLCEIESRMPVDADPHSSFTWTERQLGNFSDGRFGWVLTAVGQLLEPIPYKGQQGLFNIPDEILEGVIFT